jgi:lysozyme
MDATSFELLKQELQRDEAKLGKPALKPYRDSVGKLTIGYGRNLDDVGIMPFEADDLLEHDIVACIGALSTRLAPWFDKLDDVRQRALINMSFMGVDKLLGFVRMLEALRNAARTGDQRFYDLAADELMDSKYARQVGQRAVRLAHMIRKGTVL